MVSLGRRRAIERVAYIPSRGAVEGLGHVVIALSVSTHVEHLVLHVSGALTVQAEDVMVESLPLSLFMGGIVLCVRIVGTVDQTQVHLRLSMEPESAGLSPMSHGVEHVKDASLGYLRSQRWRHSWWDHLGGRSL